MLRSLESTGLPVHYFERHERLALSQDYWWKIEEGAVRAISWREDGTLFALGIWGKGDIVGGPLCQVSPLELECLNLVRVVQVPHSHWPRAVDDLVRYIQRSGEFLQIVQGGDIAHSLRHLLVWLAPRFGLPYQDGLLIDLPLTHRDLAELIGTTRVTVTRLLKDLEQQGMMYRVGRQVVLRHQTQAIWPKQAV